VIRLAGVALDARAATRTDDARQLAVAARWIAGNALAARGLCVPACDDPPPRPRRFDLCAASVTAVLASLATMPALVDPSTLPVRWRIALRALGIPLLDRPAAVALAAGACVLSIVPHAHSEVPSAGRRSSPSIVA
jgi:hypothetical protein